MSDLTQHSDVRFTGRIDRRTHSIEQLRDVVDGWDGLSTSQKRLVTTPSEKLSLDDLDGREYELATTVVEPADEETVYNVTTDRFHQYFVDNLDPGQTASKDNLTASWLAVGDDAASGTATSDTDLNNRVYSDTINDHIDNSKDLVTSTFLASSDANGFDLDELGLFTGDPANLANNDVFMINHATFSAVTKTNAKTVTIDVTLSFSDV